MMIKKEYPRVLVVSNNCFSKSGSNGRTLANFFQDWDINNLAQFYITNEYPDSDVCKKYFRITDREALKVLIRKKPIGRIVEPSSSNNKCTEISSTKYKTRTPLKMLLRNIVWKSYRWKTKKVEDWLHDFNPEVIFLQAGDSAFMYDIALSIAKDRNIPLVMYNSEDYYFKQNNYFTDAPTSFWFKPFMLQLRKSFENTMEYCSYCIYITDKLSKMYHNKFKHNSIVIMTSTDVETKIFYKVNDPLKVAYLGNLGIGRDEPLVELGECMHELNSNLVLDVYGKIPNPQVAERFSNCDGINYKGIVEYDVVKSIMKDSDLLVYVENFSDFYRIDLQNAFSSKIPDSLASGTCLLAYGPADIASIDYLKSNNCACVISDKDKLKEIVGKLILDRELRDNYVNNALKVVDERHNNLKNSEAFREIIDQVVALHDKGER